MLKRIVLVSIFLLVASYGQAKQIKIAVFPWVKQSIQSETYSALGLYAREYLVSLLKKDKKNYLFSTQTLVLWQAHHKDKENVFPADIVIVGHYQQVGKWFYIQIEIIEKAKNLKRTFTLKESELSTLFQQKIIPLLQQKQILSLQNKTVPSFVWTTNKDIRNLFFLSQAIYTNQIISLALIQDLSKKINPRTSPEVSVAMLMEAKILYAARRKSKMLREQTLRQAIVFLQQALLYHKHNASLHRLLSEAYALLGTYNTWVYKTANQALQLDPYDITSLFLRAFAIGWENQAAMEDLNTLIKQYPWLWQEVTMPTSLFQQGHFDLELSKAHSFWKNYQQKKKN